MSATIFDSDDSAVDAKLGIWARNQPPEGAYIVNNCGISTNPLRIIVSEATGLRQIPEEFDGTDPEKPSLPTAAPFLSGIAVVKFVHPNKKEGILSGFTFMGRTEGWVRFDVNVAFENMARWAAWTLPPPRTLVTFDAVLARVDSEGAMHANLRRISFINEAHRALLQELGMGHSQTEGRAAKLAEVRQNAAKNKRTHDDDQISPAGAVDEDALGPSPVASGSGSTVKATTPAGKKVRGAAQT
ncbi:hypothetical protein CF319_g8004 [Tilletia indica]|nr:hypothetical protein CF319_g8004 [Tilletia indica]